jgi:hypothetical protein
MPKINTNKELRKILGSAYGGPSISVNESNEFVLYTWSDAPVGMLILETASTLENLVTKFQRKKTS